MALRVQKDEWLEQSVSSALDQTVPAELIVVTAAETPSSNIEILRKAARRWPRRMRVVRRPRPGFAVALNTGFARADADRVGILHSDDWLDPRTIEGSLSVDADIVSGGKRVFAERSNGDQELTFEWVGSRRTFEGLSTLEEKARYVTHFLLMRRELVRSVGGVDESLGDLSGVDDFDMIWSMLEAGGSVGFTRKPYYRVRDHPGERLTLRSAAEQLTSLSRILDKHHVPAESRAALVASHSRWYGRTLSDVLVDDEDTDAGASILPEAGVP
jgi:glycosyltransferase involved in cell wall biosynthesis